MLDKLNHYSLTNPGTVYDEEALTALELAGRTAAKVNEAVTAFNDLETETNQHLADQDEELTARLGAQDENIRRIREVSVPAYVKAECQRLIAAGEFDAAINLYMGNLNERVDTLLGSVTEGSTTLDAELIDMRTGSDGSVYDNAGNAMRAQFGRMDNVLQIKPDWVECVYISQSTGSEIRLAVYDTTTFIHLPANVKKIGVRTAMGADDSGLCFYDMNKNYISGQNISGGTTNIWVSEIVDVPVGAAYVRYSFANSWLPRDKSYLFLADSLFALLAENEPLPTYIALDITPGQYFGDAGKILTIDSDKFMTAELDVLPFQSFTLTAASIDGSRIYAIYDKDGNMLSVYPNSNRSPAKTETVNIKIPKNGARLLVGSYKEEILLSENIDTVALNEQMKVMKNDITELSRQVQRTYSYAFDNILCIGDSLTAGACYINGKTGGSINQNYPYYLGRMLNCNVTNGGLSGWSASDWYKRIGFYDYAAYDGFIIWLGTNYGCNSMPTDAEINSFVPDENVSAEDANQALYLIKIIQTIKAKNPDAVIFLCNCFASKSPVATNNATLATIAAKYGLPLIDMTDLGTTARPELHGNILNPHFGKAGNMYIANRVIENIAQYFNNNPALCEFGY